MFRNSLKCILITLLLVSFINRSLFVSSPGSEIDIQLTDKAEINSLLELIVGVVKGHQNQVDEDGNSQESYNIAHISQPIIHEVFTDSDKSSYFISVTEHALFPLKESFPVYLVYGTIDHPPEGTTGIL